MSMRFEEGRPGGKARGGAEAGGQVHQVKAMAGSRRVVLGLGNILNHDEGLGVIAQAMLKNRVGVVPGLEVYDGGVLGLDLLPLVTSAGHLLVLDAVDAGRQPGELIELDGREIPFRSRVKLSPHQLAFVEVLEMAALRGGLPALVRLCGLQPADVSMGLGLSPQVEAALPALVDRAEAVLKEWGLL